ncbi:hypothetical protein, partial [Pseudomonas sp.]|uniref:hypothetical protein n=2 Tax=Pseudomonas TaxID=286 RepID=UPI0028ABA009
VVLVLMTLIQDMASLKGIEGINRGDGQSWNLATTCKNHRHGVNDMVETDQVKARGFKNFFKGI